MSFPLLHLTNDRHARHVQLGQRVGEGDEDVQRPHPELRNSDLPNIQGVLRYRLLQFRRGVRRARHRDERESESGHVVQLCVWRERASWKETRSPKGASAAVIGIWNQSSIRFFYYVCLCSLYYLLLLLQCCAVLLLSPLLFIYNKWSTKAPFIICPGGLFCT